jgi:hypothetical protein
LHSKWRGVDPEIAGLASEARRPNLELAWPYGIGRALGLGNSAPCFLNVFFPFRAAFLIAALAAPVLAAAQPASLLPPGETGPISPAEDVWGRVATLLRDPAMPLTRKTVEKALGVRLKLDPTVGNGSNVFRLPNPGKWPILLSLAQNITLVEHGTLVPRTELGIMWNHADERYKLRDPKEYCVLKSDFESLIRTYKWTTDTSLPALTGSIAMDAPVMVAIWRRGQAEVELSSTISPDCLGDFTLDKPTTGDQK